MVGSVSIVRKADLVVLSDLAGFVIDRVFVSGSSSADSAPKPTYPAEVFDTVKLGAIRAEDLRIESGMDTDVAANIIVATPDAIFTDWRVDAICPEDGILKPNAGRDTLSIAVIER